MASWTPQEITQRAAQAEAARAEVQPIIEQCLAMAMPWRSRLRNSANFDHLFDDSAATGAQRFASRLQRDLTPPFQRWFKLEAGPLVDASQHEAVNTQLELATHIVHAVLDASAFPKASREMYGDLAVGTAALLNTEGDDNQPIRWQSAPAWALGIEEGADGRIWNVYWTRPYPAWQLPHHWPNADWPAKVKEMIAAGERKPVEILQASYHDEGGWRIAILCRHDNEKAIVWESDRRTNPWIIPRWWTTPGSPWGRGPLMLSLPNIKTTNKTVEMILRAAAYQLAPPLMVLHDGVINPDQMRMSPNALIRVARTGGPMGRSIEPIELGSKVDLAQIVLEDLRGGIAKNLLNEQLPPTTGAVRSASEIVERAKQLQYDAGAAFAQMNHEFVPQVIACVIDMLDRKKVPAIDWKQLRVDQLVLRVNVISPLARSQALDDIQNTVQWAETLKALGGDRMLMHSAVVEDLGAELGQDFGVKQKLIRPKADRTKLEQAEGALAAQQMQQGAAPAGGGAGGAQPAPFQTAPASLGLTPGA